MTSKKTSRGFTLVELLVVIGIIAVLSIVVVYTLNPAALYQKSRDSRRISDLTTLGNSLDLYLEDTHGSIGSSSVVYVSIPDPMATSSAGDQCQGLGLPTILYPYQCASSTTYRNVNGTGWIPVNFTNITGGAPLSVLPVDPVNSTSTNLYYTFQTDGVDYDLSSFFESPQNASKTVSDGGYDPLSYEITSAGSLGGYVSRALTAYYSFEEGTGTTEADLAGGHTGTWYGTPAGTNSTYYTTTAKVGTYAGYFDGTDNYVDLSGTGNQFTSGFTVSAWVYYTGTFSPGQFPRIFSSLSASSSGFEAILHDTSGSNANKLYFQTGNAGSMLAAYASSALIPNTWYNVAVTYDGTTGDLYINGALNGSFVGSSAIGNSGSGRLGRATDLTLGEWPGNPTSSYWKGSIDEARAYNRVLSAAEIAEDYNAEK